MRLGDMPLAERGGFVLVEAEAGRERHFRDGFTEAEVARRVVRRVAAEHHQRVHFAAVDVVNELAQRLQLARRAGRHLVGVQHGDARVAEGAVDGVADRVNGRRLLVAGHHDRRALVREQVARGGVQQFLRAGGSRRGRRAGHPDRGGKCPRERLDVCRAHGRAVIGLRARVARRALDGVEAAHLAGLASNAPGGREVADVPHRPGHRPQEVRVERHHHARLVERVARVDDGAERQLGAAAHVVAAGSLGTDATWPTGTLPGTPPSASPAWARSQSR